MSRACKSHLYVFSPLGFNILMRPLNLYPAILLIISSLLLVWVHVQDFFIYRHQLVGTYIAANHIGEILWIIKNTSKPSKFSKLKFTIFSKRCKNISILIYFDFITNRYRKKSYLLTLSNWNPGNWGVSLIKEAMFKDFYQALRKVSDCPNIFWFAESLWNFLFCFRKW